MNAATVHPPIYTKVMGRPKKNRKKTLEDKEQHGVKFITRAGVTMHYSVCGNPNHNKKGHAKWVLDNLNGATNVEDEDVDDPSVMQHLMPITPDPRNDPMHQMRTLVHQMGQEAAAHFPIPRVQQPLPEESAFVVSAREELPPTRLTTVSASARGRGGGREAGRGRANAQADRGRASASARGIGGGREPGRGRASASARGRGGGRKRKEPTMAEGASSSQPTVEEPPASNARRRGYNTGPGSSYYLLFGDEQPRNHLPDLNEAFPSDNPEEIQISQTAPR
ncbi:hypothetical protein QYE76_008275 [Lolium multiflorum]|uniref:Uncharacterized protein n=1 Tax=Lolium multiflorum TaxID=4521 RepID=A0AAD8PW61_LOLMU|nr:hypothetical protein QYE76_008275 [Lolium multiflorum]